MNKITYAIISIAAIMGGLIGIISIRGGSRDLPPSLWLETNLIEFGPLPDHATASRSIKVKNVGGIPLKISQIETTCGCTEARVEDSEISPGKSSLLSVTIISRARKGPGRVAVDLYTNDPKRPVNRVEFTYSQGGQVYLEPSSIDFGSIPASSLPKSQMTKLIVASGSGIDFDRSKVRVDSDSPYISASLKDATELGGYILDVKILPGLPLGQFRSTIHVKDDGGWIDLGLNVHGALRGPFYASPSTALIGPCRPSGGDDSIAILVTGPAEGVEVVSRGMSESLEGLVQVDVLPLASKVKKIVLSLSRHRLPESWAKKRLAGNVRLECRSAGLEAMTLEIPVVLILERDPNPGSR